MKLMPIILNRYDSEVLNVPWDMIEPHAHQADLNHDQTLERLAERGGLSPCEALAVLDDRSWHEMTYSGSKAELRMRIDLWHEQSV